MSTYLVSPSWISSQPPQPCPRPSSPSASASPPTSTLRLRECSPMPVHEARGGRSERAAVAQVGVVVLSGCEREVLGACVCVGDRDGGRSGLGR